MTAVWLQEPPFPPGDLTPPTRRVEIDVDGAHYWVDTNSVTDPTADDVRAILSPAVTIIGYAEFRERFTDAEKQALHAARAISWQIDDFIGLAQAEGQIDLDNPAVPTAKAALIAAGVLTIERAAAVFS